MFYELPLGLSSLVYLVAIVVFLSVLFFFLFSFNVYFLERLSNLIYKKRIVNKDKIYSQAVSLLENAREQALEIIKEANTRAQDILNSSDIISSEANESFKNEIERLHSEHMGFLQKISEDTLSTYKRLIEDEKNKGMVAIGDTVSNVETITSGALTELKTEIDSQREIYEEALRNSMKENMERAREDLKAYKERKIAEIDSNVKLVVRDVSKDVLGKSLSLADHEDLVIKALEDAKVMGVLKND